MQQGGADDPNVFIQARWPAWLLTLTPSVLNAAAQVTSVVSGEARAEMLKTVPSEGPQRPAVPAQMVQSRHGRLRWMADVPWRAVAFAAESRHARGLRLT